MPPPDPQQIADFLETLAKLLKEPVVLPEFGDLFQSTPSQTGDGQVVQATPDQIETAVVISLQKIAIAQQEQQQAKRVEGQWEVVYGVADSLEKAPEQPDAKALGIVEPSKLPDVDGLAEAASRAVQTLTAARGEPDDVFEKATAEAIAAIEARNDAIGKLHDALEQELASRRDTVKKLEQTLQDKQSSITGKLAEVLAMNKSPTKGVAALKRHLEQTGKLVQGLPGLIDSALPATFTGAFDLARKSVDEVDDRIGATSTWTTNETTKDQRTAIEKLPKDAPKIADGARKLVSTDLVADYDQKATEWVEWRKNALNNTFPIAEDAFGGLLQAMDQVLGDVQAAADKVRVAADEVTEARGKRVAARQLAGGEVVKPTNVKSGTDEATLLANAEKAFKADLEKLSKLVANGAADAFESADGEVEKALLDYQARAKDAGQAATKRETARKLLKENTVTSLKDVGNQAISALKSGPIQAVTTAVTDVLNVTSRKLNAISGLDPVADQKVADEVLAVAKNALAVGTELAKLKKDLFDQVGKNVDVVQLVDKLVSDITSGQLTVALFNPDGGIARKCGNVDEKYTELDEMQDLYETAIEDKRFAPDWQKVIAGYPAFQKDRDSYPQGELTKKLTLFQQAITEIDEAAANFDEGDDIKARPTYNASACMTFVNAWNTNTAAASLQALVTQNKVVVGTRLKAYRTNYDKPDKYSIEANIRIEGWSRVVLHAHCDKDGTPLPGNACHLKLSSQKMQLGVSAEFTPTLRTAVLPPKERCYSAAKKMKFVT